MEKRNFSSWILLFVVAGILMHQFWPILQEQFEQNTKYIIQISGEEEITEKTVAELAKLSGMEAFYPILSCSVTLQMKNYSMPAELRGVDLSMYPLTLDEERSGTEDTGYEASRQLTQEESEQEASWQLTLGHEPQLLIQEGLWKELRDSYDHGPLESQVEKWKENYDGVELTLNWDEEADPGREAYSGGDVYSGDETASGTSGRRKRQASIAGIFTGTEEANIVYMDRQQLLDWTAEIGTSLRVRAGCLQIRGLENVKDAREILEEAGFEVTKEEKL